MEWQPIETAPRDGTAVIVYAPNMIEPKMFIMAYLEFEGDPDLGGWYDTGCIDSCHPIFDGDATHWMPLPEPPK